MTFLTEVRTEVARGPSPAGADALAIHAQPPREEVWRALMRLPVTVVVSGFLFALVGVMEGVVWLGVVLSLEGICFWTRGQTVLAPASGRALQLAAAGGVSLCWVAHALLLWGTDNEIARIAAIMDLFSVALYGAIGAQKDRQLMSILLGPPLLTLSAVLIGFAWREAAWPTATIATLGAIGACVTIVLNAIALHRSDRALVTANAALDAERRALDARVRARTAELSQAMEAAQAASRAKSAFVATMSHELRTPLSAVIGYAELLEEDLRSNTANARPDDAARIARAAREQLAMINDVLDLSKIDAGQISIHPADTDLRALLDSVVAAIAPLAQANGNTITVDVDGDVDRVVTDAARLRQCLVHIAGNAAKFTAAGEVRIVARVSGAKRERRLDIRVSDTGCGISPAQQSSLFEPFVQGDSSAARAFGGVGLGLAITRRLVTLLGGCVALESSSPSGSTFLLQLPLIYPAAR